MEWGFLPKLEQHRRRKLFSRLEQACVVIHLASTDICGLPVFLLCCLTEFLKKLAIMRLVDAVTVCASRQY
jgi:hypothetical protein